MHFRSTPRGADLLLPELFHFELFGRTLSVNGYGLMIGIGLVLWTWLVGKEARRLGLVSLQERTTSTLLVFIAALFVGGKGLYLLTLLGERAPDADDFQYGFVFYGGLLTAAPVMAWQSRRLGLGVLQGLDIFALPAPLAHAFGRLGCFLAGCCYGHRCSLPWAVRFEHGRGLNGVFVHPVQLYESLGLLALFAVLWFFLRPRKRFDGQILFTYFLGYAALRCVTELFRGDPDRRILFADSPASPGDPPHGIPLSTMIALVTALLCLLALFWLRRRPSPPAS